MFCIACKVGSICFCEITALDMIVFRYFDYLFIKIYLLEEISMNVWILVANSSVEVTDYSTPSMITLDDHTDLKAFESFYHSEGRERSKI